MRVAFTSHGHKLVALMDSPHEDAPVAYAIFAPCFTCNKTIKTAAYLGRALAAKGIAVLRIDFRGLGESEGEFVNTSLSTNIEDLLAAARYLAECHQAPTLIIGHSFGGTAAIRTAAQIDSIRAVVTINSPADPRHITTHFPEKLPLIQLHGQAQVDIVGRPFPISRTFIQDLDSQNHPQAIARLKKPLLICHAPKDDLVPLSEAAAMFQAAEHPKSFLSLDTADHFLSDRADIDYAASVIAAWAGRYIA